MFIEKKDVEPFLGMVVDIIYNVTTLITLTVDKIDGFGIHCQYWERYCLEESSEWKFDNHDINIEEPGYLEFTECESIKLSNGFKSMNYTSDSDLGI